MMKNFYTNLLIRIDRKYLLAISVKTYSKKKLRKHIDVYFKKSQEQVFLQKIYRNTEWFVLFYLTN